MTSIATAHTALRSDSYVSDYDAIVETMNRYNDGVQNWRECQHEALIS